jgi:hypothetical protein
VDKALREVADWEKSGLLNSSQGRRRAAVFYVDRVNFLIFLNIVDNIKVLFHLKG